MPGVRPGLLDTGSRVSSVTRGTTEHATLLPGLSVAVVVVVVDVVEVDAESAGRCCAVVRLVPVSGSGPGPRVSREHQHFTEKRGLLTFSQDRDLSAVWIFIPSLFVYYYHYHAALAVFTSTSEHLDRICS